MNRAQAMETKEFSQRMGDKVREEDHVKRILTDEQISIFLYYTHNRDHKEPDFQNRKEPDFEEGGRFLHECLAPMADKIIDEIIEKEEERISTDRKFILNVMAFNKLKGLIHDRN